jgi:hypothetical protein
VDERAPSAFTIVGPQPPYCLTRRDEVSLLHQDAPYLTITSDPGNSVAVVGSSRPDWALSFCAHGEGDTETEAHANLQQLSLRVAGSTLVLTGGHLYARPRGRGHLIVHGPADGGLVIHGSYTPVTVQDTTGPVRIAAAHARATILETIGDVDTTAGVVDFAGSRGRVTLSADREINLKVAATRFEGVLLAWAQRSVRLLVPPGFTTPIKAIVRRHANFVCRTEFAAKARHSRQGELHIFTYGLEHDVLPPMLLQLRSEDATVVIDHPNESHASL